MDQNFRKIDHFSSANGRVFEATTDFIMHYPFMKKMKRGWNVNPSLSNSDDIL